MNASVSLGHPPRVALFSGNYNYTRDGANQALNRLVAFLESRNVAVRVYSPTGDTPAFAHAGQLVSVPSFPIPRRREYRIALGINAAVREDLRAFAPNIFHLSAPDYLGYSALRLAKAWGLPAVASVHTRFETYLRYYGLGGLEKYANQYLRHFYGQCAQIYAPTDSMAQVLRAERMSHDIRIWSRGVDSRLYHPAKRDMAWRRSLGFADTDVVIAFVGRLVLEKGLAVFAETADAVCADYPEARILVVGDGPERAWFQKRLPRAVFTGFLGGEALARAYASSDLFLNPSITETFGNVTLEAMSCGLPAVCVAATGSKSLVTDGVTGLLAPAPAAEHLVPGVAALIADAGLRRALGLAGRAQAETRAWDHILLDVLMNYREVLAVAAGAVRPAGSAYAVA